MKRRTFLKRVRQLAGLGLLAGAFDLGDGRQLYINRALGHSFQVRFNVRPEVTVFELTV